MSKEEFLNYIIDFAADIIWDDWKQREQLKALFTSYCLIYGVDADTKECDDILFTIRKALEYEINIEVIQEIFLELIV